MCDGSQLVVTWFENECHMQPLAEVISSAIRHLPLSSTISNQCARPSNEIERMQHVLFELAISLLRTQA